ncbi:MAG TPA: cold shock domain-containing protein [Pseudomonadales bacterium]
MRTLFIAAASALFFAAVVTELSMRLWPGQHLALLILAFLALLVSGLLNLRLAERWQARRQPRAERGETRRRERRPRAQQRTEREGARPRRPEDAAAAGEPARSPQKEVVSTAPRETGTIKWFNRTKGFGFVIRQSGEEIFVHQRSIRMIGTGENRRRPALRDGQAVSFVVAEREKGLQAEDVVPED